MKRFDDDGHFQEMYPLRSHVFYSAESTHGAAFERIRARACATHPKLVLEGALGEVYRGEDRELLALDCVRGDADFLTATWPGDLQASPRVDLATRVFVEAFDGSPDNVQAHLESLCCRSSSSAGWRRCSPAGPRSRRQPE